MCMLVRAGLVQAAALLCNYHKIHTFDLIPSNLVMPKLFEYMVLGGNYGINLCMDWVQDTIAPNVQISYLCKCISN